jgi:hypothetical protein
MSLLGQDFLCDQTLERLAKDGVLAVNTGEQRTIVARYLVAISANERM